VLHNPSAGNSPTRDMPQAAVSWDQDAQETSRDVAAEIGYLQ
jgi:hypothetical protein